MDIKEFCKLKVGDKVRIVSEKTSNGWNSYGLMDKWLGKVMTVRGTSWIGNVKMVEDKNEGIYGTGWEWAADMIECKVTDTEPQPTIVEHLIKGNKVIVKLSNGKVGVAACSPEDKFDICEGLKLAIDRAYGKVPGFKKDKKKEPKNTEPKVKEVNRSAKVGEWIKIVKPYDTKGKYKKGDVLKVINTAWSEDARTEYDGIGNVGRKGFNYINRDEYVVLENYKPEPEVKEVKRKAKVGEWVKIVYPYCPLGYNTGDILQVTHETAITGDTNYIRCKIQLYPFVISIRDTEYVVLENYKPNKK